jgi:hypothetical protein
LFREGNLIRPIEDYIAEIVWSKESNQAQTKMFFEDQVFFIQSVQERKDGHFIVEACNEKEAVTIIFPRKEFSDGTYDWKKIG